MASVGVTLRNEREAQGRALEDIAQELCLMPTYLRAIEVDNVAALPGTFFYKSFVRQYADLLGLNTALLQSEVDELVAVAEPAPTVPEKPIRVPDAIVQEANRFDFSRRSLKIPSIALVLALAGGGVFYSWWKQPAKAAAVPVPMTVASAPTPAVVPAAAPTPELPSEPVVNVTSTTGADGVRHLELNLSASETTWLSISSNGKQIFAGVLHPEETKTLSGLDVARLKVGNAGGLNVQWNGKEIGSLGQKGQVRVVIFTPEGFSILPGNSSETL